MPRRFSVLGWLISGIVASPHHDELQARTRLHRAPQLYGSTVLRERRLDSIGADDCPAVHTRPLESIRIGYEIIASDAFSQAIKDHVETEILARAIAYWQAALKVHRTTAPLRADHDPSQCSRLESETIWTCQQASAPICGVDGAAIPAKFLSNTVGSGYQMCQGCATLQQGAGAAGYDFFLFVDIQDSASCAGDTQAYATACVQDQCDRPIFASVMFCLSKVSTHPSNTSQQVSIAVHEIAHALAFSSRLFKYFRNADGSPKLAREADDATRIQGTVAWTCTSDASYTYPDADNGNRDYVDLQTKGLVTTMDERGIGTCPCPLGQNSMSAGCIVPQEPSFRTPKCVVKMITPKVVEKVREHFDCNNLAGAELENQATSGCTIVGSHWEARIFLTEVMVAVHSGLTPVFISAVTLALFEDSGWYQPDYSLADTLVANVHWGYRQGCSFAKQPCVSSGTTSFGRFWCASESATACSLDRHGVQQCNTDTYGSALPAAVGSYYDGGVTVGTMAEADYCPFYSTVVTNRVCLSTDSIFLPYTNVNYMREVFGSTSRCLDSTLHADVPAEGGAVFTAVASDFVTARPSCYEVVCAADGASYEVKLSDQSSLGTCHNAGEALTKAGLQGSVLCAAPAELCGVLPSKMASIIPLPTTTAAPRTVADGLPDSALVDAALQSAHGHCKWLRWTLTSAALLLAAF